MNDKLPVVRRAIEAKKTRPEYQRLDLDVKEGGKSLLHDEHGIPKVAPVSGKINIPIMVEMSNEPVSIQASMPEEKESGGSSRRYLPSKSAEDDRFIPPRSNFVSVGQVDRAWQSDGGINDEIIDNNDEVNVHAVQGIDPLQGIPPENFDEATVKDQESLEIRKNVDANLKAIRASAIAELAHASTLEEVQTIKKSLFSKSSGIFTIILKKFGSLPASERPMIGEMVNECITDLHNEIKVAEAEFDEAEEDEFDEPTQEEKDSFIENKKADAKTESVETELPAPTLEEGMYGILFDGELFYANFDLFEVKKILSEVLFDKEIDRSRFQLIKRLSINFGITIGE